MPKTRRKKASGKPRNVQAQQTRSSTTANKVAGSPAMGVNAANRRRAGSPQNLLFSVMVAVGCWGLACSFLFFSNDPNRYIFGAMAGLMALGWSAAVILRMRRMMVSRT